jgi:ketosteroid isomerase-like protein
MASSSDDVAHREQERTMAEHPNVALIRRGFAAFNTGDVATLTEVIAADAVQHMAGDNQFSGDHKGRDNILAMYGAIAELTGGTYQATLESVYANDHRAIAIYRSTGSRGSETLDVRQALAFEIMDGRAVDLDELPLDGQEHDAFWT